MKNKYFWILLISVMVTLIGLIIVQALWIRNALDIKEKLFAQQVNEALTSVVNALQQEETVYYISHEFPSIIDSTQKTDIHDKKTGTIDFPNEINLFSKQKQKNLRANISVVPNKIDSFGGSTMTQEYEISVLNKARLVERIVNRFINSHLKITERLKDKTLKNTIEAEFLLKGIKLSYEYAVTDELGNEYLKSEGFSDSVKKSTYLVRLYPDDIFNQAYFLSLYFPDEQSYIIRSTSFMIISSIVLTTIIIIIISLAIYIIFRQKRLSEIKTDFINNMTHELKTPISTISLASQMLGDNNIPVEQKNIGHLSKLLLDESKRLGLQVEKVLQMAVFDKAQIKLRLKRININDLVNNVLNNFAIQVKNHNGQLIRELNAERAVIIVDEVHITNIIVNLLDNAIKYTSKEPEIQVTTKSTEKGIIISVADNGIGISKENQKKVFEQFYRVPTGNIHNAKGFGLGLSYVKKITEAHKGSVEIESKPGQGSKFSIFLPYEFEE